MACLALAMEAHWCQIRTPASFSAARARKLRGFGASALLSSLAGCLVADHATVAGLVWVMTLSASALTVAMTLAYRPRWLSWLATVSGSREPHQNSSSAPV
jgi:hypothetical protein